MSAAPAKVVTHACAWRARAAGVFRLWRDSNYPIGALVAGITADLFGLRVGV
ncbi:hypothetical protein [Micromonospora sp. NPDC006431]|uniref:hypothetical protein n=1 Tax=Micromonospora sp. NPDC006431 TaxID=3364235 RepID=UPI003686CE0A